MLRLPRHSRAAIHLLLIAIATLASLAVARTAAAQNIDYTYTLRWTAPGDDSTLGRAQAYDLRYSRTPITEANWGNAPVFIGVQTPGTPGTKESFTLYGLDARYDYYVAIKTCDEKGNWSKMSNLLQVHTPQLVAAVTDSAGLTLSAPWPNPARNGAHFAFALPHPGPVEMEALDISGRRVRVLAHGIHAAGRSEIVWDLKDDHGQPVAPGIYLVRGKVLDRETTRSVAVVR